MHVYTIYMCILGYKNICFLLSLWTDQAKTETDQAIEQKNGEADVDVFGGHKFIEGVREQGAGDGDPWHHLIMDLPLQQHAKGEESK